MWQPLRDRRDYQTPSSVSADNEIVHLADEATSYTNLRWQSTDYRAQPFALADPKSRRGLDIHILDNPTSTISQEHTGEGRRGDGELLALRARNGSLGLGHSRSHRSISQSSTDESADDLTISSNDMITRRPHRGNYRPREPKKGVLDYQRRPSNGSLDDTEILPIYTEPPPAQRTTRDDFQPDPALPPLRTGKIQRGVTEERSEGRVNSIIEQEVPPSSPDEPEVIEAQIRALKSRIKVLERSRVSRKLGPPPPEPWQKQIIYRVFDSEQKKPNRYDADEFFPYGESAWSRAGKKKPVQVCYFFDPPRWTGKEAGHGRLEGTRPVSNIETYIKRSSRLAFIIFRDYDGKNSRRYDFESTSGDLQNGNARPFAESLCILVEDLLLTLRSFLLSLSSVSDFYQKVAAQEEFQAPYLFVYHHQKELAEFEKKQVPDALREQWSLLMDDYIQSGFSAEYHAADEALARGVVTHRLFKYLIKPGDVLLSYNGPNPRACQAHSWASSPISDAAYKEQRRGRVPLKRHERDRSGLEDDVPLGDNILSGLEALRGWNVQVTHWDFHSTFYRESYCARIMLEAKFGTEVPVTSLGYYPIRYASDETTTELRRRGNIFWQCRTRKYVECKEDSDFHAELTTTRYMIDPQTYLRLHGRNALNESEGGLAQSMWEAETPPEDPFVLMLPPSIKGFNMHEKKWVDLDVARISNVSWNTQAFKSLVADQETKDLIEALVQNKLETQPTTDLIDGKGNGLILLLHGGPGTGKTFTAESVAEIAQKPLYRVTCGDIGTTPDHVEEYLESVLYLGRLWGCVVLLDEADVFLEERTLTDLSRNALVSVFLRVLEYYSGILILTSNRVGTFDEAFRSRIQLTLRYESLTLDQRHQIWQNFLNHIQSFNENETIDFADINSHLSDLCRHKMNGREIRNCITTGRQLAQFRKTKLNFSMLQNVIDVAGRFNKYLEDVKQAELVGPGGTFADNVAREAGTR